jgi:hypothetical protein
MQGDSLLGTEADATSAPTSFDIRQLVKAGKLTEARSAITRLLAEECDVAVGSVHINDDPYSLNSVNGLITTLDGQRLFFKFHTEENEALSVDEYYCASVLSQHGLPVDMPLKAVTKPGKQILIYDYRQDRKLSDVCLAIECDKLSEFSLEQIVTAQRKLDIVCRRVAVESFSPPTADSVHESLHQLFYNRLVDANSGGALGGRYRTFYAERSLSLGGKELPWQNLAWQEFESLKWKVNGVTYKDTMRSVFERCLRILNPETLSSLPVIVSHGDSHNANIWVQRRPIGAPQLVMFDPAFAGSNIPLLLGEIKATFHNIFAHPFWLYTPELAHETLSMDISISDGTLNVVHNWKLSPLREHFLQSKLENYWIPLLLKAESNGLLPKNWDEIMRAALFCCPMLVMNMLPSASSPARTLPVSLLGMAVAMSAGSTPEDGNDVFSSMFDQLRKAVGARD